MWRKDGLVKICWLCRQPGALTFGTWIDRQQEARTEIVGNDRLNVIGATSEVARVCRFWHQSAESSSTRTTAN
jgi:hypothetical protein